VVSRETPGSPPALPPWLGGSADSLAAYVELLSSDGVTRGLIGPREVTRLWSRHVLNCAVVVDPSVDLVPAGARVVDVGSGAGLPGVVWAIARPDLRVLLIEPLLRRATFLDEAVGSLGLSERVQVWRGRAEDAPAELRGHQVATARAVAPLGRLVRWLTPLLDPGGTMIALKGSTAGSELEGARGEVADAGIVDARVLQIGQSVVDPPTTVVVGQRRAAE
jgi:16S rRNA (guanine527-N7)-methyltransferase